MVSFFLLFFVFFFLLEGGSWYCAQLSSDAKRLLLRLTFKRTNFPAILRGGGKLAHLNLKRNTIFFSESVVHPSDLTLPPSHIQAAIDVLIRPHGSRKQNPRLQGVP
jgi:hypothetical protein